MRLSVVLPAYNEDRTIASVLDAILRVDLSSLDQPVDLELIVVDDASTDRTREIAARRPEVKLVSHEVNRGKGAAIRTALREVTGDIVLIQDADREYSVSDYPALLKPFLEGNAQVVYGSRFLKRPHPTNMRLSNYLANRLLTFTANLLFAAGLTDEATCFKVFRADLLKSLPLRAQGFDFCPEVTALVRLRRIRIHEVPVEYTARTRAEGKKIRWADGLQALRTLFACRLRKAVCSSTEDEGKSRGEV